MLDPYDIHLAAALISLIAALVEVYARHRR